MEVMATMATTSSKAIMGSLAEKLKALLGREYDLQVGVHEDVRSLQSELEFMHAFLQDYYASYQQTTTSAYVKVWARKVRELAYDAEDAIDDFTCRVGPAPKGIPAMVKHFVYTLMARHQIAKQLRHLRHQAVELSEQRKRYAPLGTSPSSPNVQLPPPAQPADETTANLLVGIDGPRDEFIAKLTSSARKHQYGRHRVASMVGTAGVGKTTLAKAVYHSLEDLFPCRAFVTVSRQLDTRRVLKDILRQVMVTTESGSSPSMPPCPGSIASMETWEDSQLVDSLKHILMDKRYLIIVDDLWEKSAWHRISGAIPDNFLDSMIITTTRNESVAKACCPWYHPAGHFVHKVPSLKHLDSRTLFLRRTFGSEDKFPHDLEELSMKILKKCAGLPLAIVCISRLLATTGKETTKWEKVYNSLGSKSNDGLSSLWQALEVSYDDLPQHLKVCLLYLSAFPEYYKIGRDRLTRRWITEGFVNEEPGMSMQEVAENYFSELIERNMIEAVDVDCFGEIHACRVHDVMFDLIAEKSSEENFVTLIRVHGKSTSTQSQYVRRLSIDYGTAADDFDLTNFNITHVRSLTVYGNIHNLDSVPLGRYLRMLDFECCEGVNSRHLKNIGELILLKYLSLKSTWISELPPQIGYLKCLETLDLTQTNITGLPVEVTRLQRLVHLLAGGVELPQGIGNMRSLQILCIRAACRRSKEAVKELLRLTNLRKLDMTYVHPREKRRYEDESVNTLPLIISELSKCNLQSLNLNLLGYSIHLFRRIQITASLITSPPDRLQNLRIRGEYGFENVPRWIGLLSHLTDLELTVVRTMEEQDLEIIAKLPRLVRFGLTVKEPSGNGIIIPKCGFACLKELFISCRIMPVSFNQGAMPKLEKFELQFRAYHEDLKRSRPRIEHLKSLIKGLQVTIVVGKGLSDCEVNDLKNTFKSAIFI